MSKKTIFVATAIVFVTAAGFFISKILFGGSDSTGGSSGGVAGEISSVVSRLASIPEGDMLSIGTPRGAVEVKNFYKTAVGAREQFVVITSTDGFGINYDTYTSGFSVYISAAPFDTNRHLAEKDFLEILGINEADACKLKVWVGASPEDLSGYGLPRGEDSRGLSFCGGAL
ncbi:MAG: hypothetical protein HY434_02600 [Candidatus Liptonbacteria bacterium]|nr:hypothetical protein [Candidatus Liptonbacteria bacterium]